MNWLVFSVIGALLSSVWSLSVKKGLTTIFSTDFVSWYAVVSLLMTVVFNLVKQVSFTPNLFGLLAGLCQGICAIALTKSFSVSPNPGLTMAVFRTQSIITAILAFFLFNSKISVPKIIAMGVVVFGVYLLSKTPARKTEGFATTNSDQQDKKHQLTPEDHHLPPEEHRLTTTQHTKNTGKSWLILALFAGIIMSMKDILTKKALVGPNQGIYNILFNSVVAQAIFLLAYDRIVTGTFKVRDLNGDGAVDWKDYSTIGWTGIVFAAYMFTVIGATRGAPNVGYAKAIDTLGVIVTSVASHYLFGSPLTKESMGGIGLVIAGILYISLGK